MSEINIDIKNNTFIIHSTCGHFEFKLKLNITDEEIKSLHECINKMVFHKNHNKYLAADCP